MNWKYAFAVMLCAGVSMGQQPEQPAPARISGKVTGAGGQVVRRADVKLVPWSNRANPGVSTTADTEGNFEFKDVEPGRYRLSASKSGFLPQDYGARGPNQPGVPIAIAKGQEHKNLSISLLAAGTISGKVLDEDGEPMGKCLAMVLRQSVNAGRRQWIPRGGTLVNDKGEFSVGDLPPGKYHLLINPLTGMGQPLAKATGEEQIYVQMFYPGAPGFAASTPIEITPGAQLTGIDVRMRKHKVFRVSGKISGGTGTLFAIALPGAQGDLITITPRSQVPAQGEVSLCNLFGVELCTLFGVLFEYGPIGRAHGRGPKACP